MTRLNLPAGIAAYFDADKRDGDAVARCFTEQGVVKDEGQTHAGTAAIKAWKTAASAKYSYSSEPFAVDFIENNIAASTEKGFADFFAQAYGIIALARFAQNFCSIGMGYERAQANATFLHFGERSDGDLATSAEFAEQGTLTGGCCAGSGVIEKWFEEPGINDDGLDNDPYTVTNPDVLIDYLRNRRAAQAAE